MANPSRGAVTGSSRAGLLGHEAAIIWLTGLSGAGKTTLATALGAELLRARVLSVVLDGDLIGTGLSRDLGFSPAERRENMRCTGEAAALLSPFREERRQVAERARAASGSPRSMSMQRSPSANAATPKPGIAGRGRVSCATSTASILPTRRRSRPTSNSAPMRKPWVNRRKNSPTSRSLWRDPIGMRRALCDTISETMPTDTKSCVPDGRGRALPGATRDVGRRGRRSRIRELFVS